MVPLYISGRHESNPIICFGFPFKIAFIQITGRGFLSKLRLVSPRGLINLIIQLTPGIVIKPE
jgi:hypothetical protein